MAQPVAALLVVDLQLGMFGVEDIEPIHAGDALLTRVKTLLAQARRADTPFIYVRHDSGPGRLLEQGTANWQIHPAIAPAPGETIVEKRTPDTFHETSLSAELARSVQSASSSSERRARSAWTRHAGARSRWGWT